MITKERIQELKELIESEGNERTFYYKNIRCLILRDPSMLHLCGYVDLPKEVPIYGKSSDEIRVYAHGGINWSEKTEDGFWRIGFDCMHGNDLVPGHIFHLDENDPLTFAFRNMHSNDTYRDMEFVETNLISLVDQIDEQCEGIITHLDKKRIRNEKIDDLTDE